MWTRTGTLHYQAPEMFESINYTESVDMWAIGVICFELLSGELPFNHQYTSDTIELIVS